MYVCAHSAGRNSRVDDDDDFIVPDDEDEDDDVELPPSSPPARSRRGSVSSRASSRSRLSDYAMGTASEAELDDAMEGVEKVKEKVKKSRPPIKKGTGSQGSSNLFLTKAEIRMQQQKEDIWSA